MKMGDRIKELRLSCGMTQEELGNKVGVKKAAVQKWESGITENLKRSIIEELSKIFDVSPSYLMGMTDVKHANNMKTQLEINPKLKPIIHSLDRAGDLQDEDIEDIAAQVEFLINLKRKKK